jgi:hypothetical protein
MGAEKRGTIKFCFSTWNETKKTSIKKIENQTWKKANAVLFLKKSHVSVALAVQLQKRPKWPNLHKVFSAFQKLLERAKSTLKNKKKIWKKIRGVLTTSTYVHTKFESIWFKTVLLRGLQKQHFCIRSSRLT